MAEDTQRQHLPFIDGLRALAILPVVMFHAWPGLLPGGFIGVDVFFVISGFLITRLIVGELADGRFSLTRFLLRRARRLLPAAVFCFAVTSLIAALWLTPDALVNYGRSLMAACLMYANIYFYQTAGYFSAPSLEKPLLHVWSLAVEDQFYLVWPLVLFAFLPRLPSRFAVIGAMALGIASFIIATVAVRLKPDFAFYLLPARAFELMAGAALALCAETVIRWLNIARPIVLEVLGGLGLLAIGASTFVFSQLTPFAGPNAVPVTLGTVAVIASGLGRPTLTSRLLEWPLFIGIGLISYSLYLWHWPLLALLSYRLERPLQPLEAGLVVALAFGHAMLSWRFIEQPFRRSQPANLRFIGAALVATIALVGAGAAMKADRGWPWRYTGPERVLMQQLAATNTFRAKCDNYWQALTNNDVCNFGKAKAPDQSFEIAIFGDSMT